MRSFGPTRNSVYRIHNSRSVLDTPKYFKRDEDTESEITVIPHGYQRNVKLNDYSKNISENVFSPGMVNPI